MEVVICECIQKGLRPILHQIVLDHSQLLPSWRLCQRSA